MSLKDLLKSALKPTHSEIKFTKVDEPNPKGPHLIVVDNEEYTTYTIDIGSGSLIDVLHYKEILKRVRAEFPFMSHNIDPNFVPATFVEPTEYHSGDGVSGKLYTKHKGYSLRDVNENDKNLYECWGIELPETDTYKVLVKDGTDVPHKRYHAGALAPIRDKMIVGIFWDTLEAPKEFNRVGAKIDSRVVITSGKSFINSRDSKGKWSIPNPLQTAYFEQQILN